MADAPFLRSINIAQDAEHPERIMHFRPTAKCVNLINHLLGEQSERAYCVVAPYGSGKSLACTYLLHLIENNPQQESRSLLKTMSTRISEVDPSLSGFARKRAVSKRRGLTIVLEGGVSNLASALQTATVTAMRRCKLGRQSKPIERIDANVPGAIIKILSAIAEKAKAQKLDRVAILWDEFGRHLEGLVSTGKTADLADVQLLAESATRMSQLPVTLGVVMHQGFSSYAGSLPQALQAEWKKVEGRFSLIQYVDDSVELYELLGGIVTSLRPCPPPQTKWQMKAKAAKLAGIFAAFTQTKLASLLEATWPIDPAVIHVLPRLAARTAQNERTMFGFLYSRSLSEHVSSDDLYEYFAPTMEHDRGIGGTYRLWLETESACAKAETPAEVTLLRLTSLLTMALSEERGRLTPKMLELTASLGSTAKSTITASLKALLSRKLLLHRRHADQISLWHGTDIDLRGRIEAERGKLLADFSLEAFLSEEFPPPIWKPVAYNDEMAVRRFFRSRFVAVSDLRNCLLKLNAQGGLAPDSDGEIWYVITSKNTDFDTALETLSEFAPDKRLVFALPKAPAALTEPAIELLALQRLLLDESLIADDPLASNEISQMIDDVHKHLGRLVDQIVTPQVDGIRWQHLDAPVRAPSSKALRSELTRITRSVFTKTPRINSEMITRRQPSATIVNARKKVCLGIMERYGQEKLGLQGEFADSAIFRSVLYGTGLYRYDEQSEAWRFARPDELTDTRLAAVWRRFEQFMTEPSKSAKRVSDLFNPLLRPPFGLRAGLFPVLFAAAVRAFPSACSITRRDGTYIADLLPSEIEAICKEPQHFHVFVPELSGENLELLRGLGELFGTDTIQSSADSGLIRETHEAITDWIHTLPRGALNTRLITRECRFFQRALRAIEDPQRLLLKELPAIGGPSLSGTERLAKITRHKKELEDLGTRYAEETAKFIFRTLDDGVPRPNANALSAMDSWLKALPADLVDSLSSPDDRNFLRSLNTRFTSEAVAAQEIAVVCTRLTFKHWSDETVLQFRDSFKQRVIAIEAEVVRGPDGDSEAVKTYILRNRIHRLTASLADMIGDSETRQFLDTVSTKTSIEPRSEDGHRSRRAKNA